MAKPATLTVPAISSVPLETWQKIIRKKLKLLSQEGGLIEKIECELVDMPPCLQITIHHHGTISVFLVNDRRQFWEKGQMQKRSGFSSTAFEVYVRKSITPHTQPKLPPVVTPRSIWRNGKHLR